MKKLMSFFAACLLTVSLVGCSCTKKENAKEVVAPECGVSCTETVDENKQDTV